MTDAWSSRCSLRRSALHEEVWVISTALMISVAVLLAIALGAVRHARHRQLRLEHEHRAMHLELERHRATVQSILRELESP